MIHRRSALTLLAESRDGALCEGATPVLAGFAIADTAFEGGELSGHLITIDVKPELRHSGVGTRLLQTLEQRLAADGVQRMRLEVAEDNAAAHSFYRKSGYANIGRIEKYYLQSTDALLMEKSLPGREGSV